MFRHGMLFPLLNPSRRKEVRGFQVENPFARLKEERRECIRLALAVIPN
jgi:hypothetical protein